MAEMLFSNLEKAVILAREDHMTILAISYGALHPKLQATLEHAVSVFWSYVSRVEMLQTVRQSVSEGPSRP